MSEKAPAPAPEKAKPEPEAKKPVEVKVEAPAPVAVHVTPPSDTQQPTVVHLPSTDPAKPAVTVHVEPSKLTLDKIQGAAKEVSVNVAQDALSLANAAHDRLDTMVVKAAATPPKAGLSTLEKLLLCAIGLIGVLEVVQHWGEIAKHFAQ